MTFLSSLGRAILWLIGLAVLLLAGWFAFANSGDVAVSLAPFSEPLQVPLYLAVTAPLYLGVVIGALVAWVSGHAARRRARVEARRADQLAKENVALRARLETPRHPPPAHDLTRVDALTPPTLLP